MRYRRRPTEVEARQVTEPRERVMTATEGGHELFAQRGDWILTEVVGGEIKVLSDRTFKELYEEVPDE